MVNVLATTIGRGSLKANFTPNYSEIQCENGCYRYARGSIRECRPYLAQRISPLSRIRTVNER